MVYSDEDEYEHYGGDSDWETLQMPSNVRQQQPKVDATVPKTVEVVDSTAVANDSVLHSEDKVQHKGSKHSPKPKLKKNNNREKTGAIEHPTESSRDACVISDNEKSDLDGEVRPPSFSCSLTSSPISSRATTPSNPIQPKHKSGNVTMTTFMERRNCNPHSTHSSSSEKCKTHRNKRIRNNVSSHEVEADVEGKPNIISQILLATTRGTTKHDMSTNRELSDANAREEKKEGEKRNKDESPIATREFGSIKPDDQTSKPSSTSVRSVCKRAEMKRPSSSSPTSVTAEATQDALALVPERVESGVNSDQTVPENVPKHRVPRGRKKCEAKSSTSDRMVKSIKTSHKSKTVCRVNGRRDREGKVCDLEGADDEHVPTKPVKSVLSSAVNNVVESSALGSLMYTDYDGLSDDAEQEENKQTNAKAPELAGKRGVSKSKLYEPLETDSVVTTAGIGRSRRGKEPIKRSTRQILSRDGEIMEPAVPISVFRKFWPFLMDNENWRHCAGDHLQSEFYLMPGWRKKDATMDVNMFTQEGLIEWGKLHRPCLLERQEVIEATKDLRHGKSDRKVIEVQVQSNRRATIGVISTEPATQVKGIGGASRVQAHGKSDVSSNSSGNASKASESATNKTPGKSARSKPGKITPNKASKNDVTPKRSKSTTNKASTSAAKPKSVSASKAGKSASSKPSNSATKPKSASATKASKSATKPKSASATKASKNSPGNPGKRTSKANDDSASKAKRRKSGGSSTAKSGKPKKFYGNADAVEWRTVSRPPVVQYDLLAGVNLNTDLKRVGWKIKRGRGLVAFVYIPPEPGIGPFNSEDEVKNYIRETPSALQLIDAGIAHAALANKISADKMNNPKPVSESEDDHDSRVSTTATVGGDGDIDTKINLSNSSSVGTSSENGKLSVSSKRSLDADVHGSVRELRNKSSGTNTTGSAAKKAKISAIAESHDIDDVDMSSTTAAEQEINPTGVSGENSDGQENDDDSSSLKLSGQVENTNSNSSTKSAAKSSEVTNINSDINVTEGVAKSHEEENVTTSSSSVIQSAAKRSEATNLMVGSAAYSFEAKNHEVAVSSSIASDNTVTESAAKSPEVANTNSNISVPDIDEGANSSVTMSTSKSPEAAHIRSDNSATETTAESPKEVNINSTSSVTKSAAKSPEETSITGGIIATERLAKSPEEASISSSTETIATSPCNEEANISGSCDNIVTEITAKTPEEEKINSPPSSGVSANAKRSPDEENNINTRSSVAATSNSLEGANNNSTTSVPESATKSLEEEIIKSSMAESISKSFGEEKNNSISSGVTDSAAENAEVANNSSTTSVTESAAKSPEEANNNIITNVTESTASRPKETKISGDINVTKSAEKSVAKSPEEVNINGISSGVSETKNPEEANINSTTSRMTENAANGPEEMKISGDIIVTESATKSPEEANNNTTTSVPESAAKSPTLLIESTSNATSPINGNDRENSSGTISSIVVDHTAMNPDSGEANISMTESSATRSADNTNIDTDNIVTESAVRSASIEVANISNDKNSVAESAEKSPEAASIMATSSVTTTAQINLEGEDNSNLEEGKISGTNGAASESSVVAEVAPVNLKQERGPPRLKAKDFAGCVMMFAGETPEAISIARRYRLKVSKKLPEEGSAFLNGKRLLMIANPDAVHEPAFAFALAHQVPCIHEQWLVDSVQLKTLQPWTNYQLPTLLRPFRFAVMAKRQTTEHGSSAGEEENDNDNALLPPYPLPLQLFKNKRIMLVTSKDKVEKDRMCMLLRTVGATVISGIPDFALADPNEPASANTTHDIFQVLKPYNVPIVSWDWFMACLHAQECVKENPEDRELRMTQIDVLDGVARERIMIVARELHKPPEKLVLEWGGVPINDHPHPLVKYRSLHINGRRYDEQDLVMLQPSPGQSVPVFSPALYDTNNIPNYINFGIVHGLFLDVTTGDWRVCVNMLELVDGESVRVPGATVLRRLDRSRLMTVNVIDIMGKAMYVGVEEAKGMGYCAASVPLKDRVLVVASQTGAGRVRVASEKFDVPIPRSAVY